MKVYIKKTTLKLFYHSLEEAIETGKSLIDAYHNTGVSGDYLDTGTEKGLETE